MDFNPLYSLAGLLVGLLVGLTGVGGGSLMTPLLVILFGFHPATAVGTDLLYASVTKTVGTAVHGKRKTVDWRIVGRLASGSVPTAAITLFVLARAGSLGQHAVGVLNIMLGVTLLATSAAVMFQPRIVAFAQPHYDKLDDAHIARATVLLGAVLGILVSVTSVGAGAIGTTALLILYPRLPVSRIVGSDIAHAVPLTFVAGVGHWLYGAVDFGLMAALLVGSIPGIIIGSMLGSRASDRLLRPVLAATLLLVAVKLLTS
ncbi:sulfite exporter TauE/SafE family protein [Sphingomonas sp. ASV193]|uniref:sulfite exporter TauE/SafE family protein n=1 Tax=Sphingomonas sp. ASV193 TaxID=3144405 RepID=UPI0032E862EE